ncbi:LLM class flavin-dependent oxidoreductase [Sciscionella sediminilitoris]|uniref:LLM class flavin-dependent oxidoreductase n=1 Tax=Sciscionella sediminilitoris TaxID=1445613 RepID=UPI0004DF2CF2|nr:LLM class flavin-dependent oxidoreductase [Sciscionella sp. SE31]
MKFALMLDLGRIDARISAAELRDRANEIVEFADRSGFDTVFCGEHHGHELTMAPNPLAQLAAWSQRVERIRLGTAVLCAPYWHPVRLAGEAGLVDLLSDGRLELGIGRGAYTYEFARMAGGIAPEIARESLAELVPALRGLWAGDYAHDGAKYSFPATTSTPRPTQPGGPPLWISARHPELFELAVRERCNVMVAPLNMPFEEVVSLRERLDKAVASVGNGHVPRMMTLRDAFVYEDPGQWKVGPEAALAREPYFNSLFQSDGEVHEGFVHPYHKPGTQPPTAEELWQNLVFGTPSQVIEKLHRYEQAGTDVFLYGATFGVPHELEMRSLELFAEQVIPAFGTGEPR